MLGVTSDLKLSRRLFFLRRQPSSRRKDSIEGCLDDPDDLSRPPDLQIRPEWPERMTLARIV